MYEPSPDRIKEKETVLFDAIEQVEKADIHDPLWRTSTYTSPTELGPAYLTVTADHALVDGRGLQLLVLALLCSDIAHLPSETLSDVAVFEDTIDIRPSYTHLVPAIWRQLLLPLLPHLVQNVFRNPPAWPSDEFKVGPTKVSGGKSLIDIEIDLVNRLKAVGKHRGVQTLHPIVKVAYLFATWSVFGRKHGDKATPFLLDSTTPRSERSPKLGHGYCTGNYVSSFSHHASFTESNDFWVEAVKVATNLTSASGQRFALGQMGLLAYLPDPDPATNTLEPGPTGWENYFYALSEGLKPFMASISVSNLGYVNLPDGADDLIWSQGSSPFGPAIAANVIGHERGIRIVAVWREGSAVTRKQVDEMHRVYRKILERLTDDTWRETTLGILVAD